MTSQCRSRLRRISLAAWLLVFSACLPVQASTVLEMNFADVVSNAELIFEGRVTNLEARRVQNGSIHTFVTFEILDLIKGKFDHPQIELRFLGGQVGTRGLQVSDMQMPERGERGVYFVESLGNAQVNPFVGWSQGHYLIQTLDNGDRVVSSVNHEPVISVDPLTSPSIAPSQPNLSKGVAKGVTVRRGVMASATRAMTADQFKASIRGLAGQAQ